MNDRSTAPAGIYIHIPFCESFCPYCDFYSVIADDQSIERFITSLGIEIAARSIDYENRIFDTIYFGGGTPSRLGPDRIGDIIDLIRSRYALSDNSEISMECNPSSVSYESFKEYLRLGINRISIGIQSFNDRHLTTLGRIHDSAGARESFVSARKAGIGNINIDLIYGIPGQTLDDWQNDLKTAIDFGPDHLSAYNLIIEPDTPFGELHREGKLKTPSDDLQKEMYYLINDLAKENGFERYELSNFAKNNMYCRHNLKYWKNIPYLGFGPSAVSCDHSVRTKNITDLDSYCRLISEEKSFIENSENITREMAIEERIMMGLRLSDGLSLTDLAIEFGYDLAAFKKTEIDYLIKIGYLEQESDRLKITREGLFISDEIIVMLI